MRTFSQGSVLLHDNGWDHSQQGRPHIVIYTSGESGILCPLSSTRKSPFEIPIKARPGGLKRHSFVRGFDWFSGKCNLLELSGSYIKVAHLTLRELRAVCETCKVQETRAKHIRAEQRLVSASKNSIMARS